jgi:hypothetical protein
MESFKASVQYGDWQGTAAADDAGGGENSIRDYLEKKQLIKPDEFLIATSLWIGENHDGKLGHVSIRAFLLKGHRDFESVQTALADLRGEPVPVRAVEIPLTFEEFVALFKRFDVMFTRHGFKLEDREYSVTEE